MTPPHAGDWNCFFQNGWNVTTATAALTSVPRWITRV